MQTSLAPDPITPVKWWSGIPGRLPEELTDTLDRNVSRMSKESDTAEYVAKRQGAKDLVEDWRTNVLWDWGVFKGWKEQQTPPRGKKRARRGQLKEVHISAAEDFMLRATSQRSVGGLTVFRSKLWWGLLLDEHERSRGRKLAGAESRYRARMLAAGWVEEGGKVNQIAGRRAACVAPSGLRCRSKNAGSGTTQSAFPVSTGRTGQ